MQAASRSPRPPVLPALRAGPAFPAVVREARTAYNGRAAPLPGEVTRHVERTGKALDLAQAGCHAAAERLLRDAGGALVRRHAWVPAAVAATRLGRLLLERGRAGDAIDVFGDAARHADAGQDEEAAVEARLWQAAARTDAGHLVAAEAQCRAVIAAIPAGALRLRATAALTRVLFWQGRAAEAAESPRRCGNRSRAGAYVLATAFAPRRTGAAGRGGRAARELMTTAEGADPLARVIALGAHFRVLLTIGDLDIAADLLERLRGLAAAAHTPLRLARARLLMADACRRSGRAPELARELKRLARFRGRHRRCFARRSTIPARNHADAAGLRKRVGGGAAAGSDRARGRPGRGSGDETVGRGNRRVAVHAGRRPRADAVPVSTIASIGPGRPTRPRCARHRSGHRHRPEAVDAGVELACRTTRVQAARLAHGPAGRPIGRLTAGAAAARAHGRRSRGTRRRLAPGRLRVPGRAGLLRCPCRSLIGGSAADRAPERRHEAAAAPFAVRDRGRERGREGARPRALHHLSRGASGGCATSTRGRFSVTLEANCSVTRAAHLPRRGRPPGGSRRRRRHVFFLDEVADLSPRAQAKLLRVIQQQESAASADLQPPDRRPVRDRGNRDMRAEAAGGRFRHDLLYRLDVIVSSCRRFASVGRLAPLAAVLGLGGAAGRFDAALTHGCCGALARATTSRHVRELQNVIAAIAVRGAVARRGCGRTLLPPAMPARRRAERHADRRAGAVRPPLRPGGRARAGGSRNRAARELGVSRQGL